MNLLTVLSQHSRQITHTGSTTGPRVAAPRPTGRRSTPNPNTKQARGSSARHSHTATSFRADDTVTSSNECRARRDLAPPVPVVWGLSPPPLSLAYDLPRAGPARGPAGPLLHSPGPPVPRDGGPAPRVQGQGPKPHMLRSVRTVTFALLHGHPHQIPENAPQKVSSTKPEHLRGPTQSARPQCPQSYICIAVRTLSQHPRTAGGKRTKRGGKREGAILEAAHTAKRGEPGAEENTAQRTPMREPASIRRTVYPGHPYRLAPRR